MKALMQICIGNVTIIGSDNDLSTGRRQGIIWTNAWVLLIVMSMIIQCAVQIVFLSGAW